MNNETPLLQVSEASVVREGKIRLAPVSFVVDKGEFLWLTGPSGAGKSTLLKVIASLLEPSSGEVRFNGRSIAELKPEQYRQRVSYVFQTPQLFGQTVYDNLSLPYLIRQQRADRQHLGDELQRVNLPRETLDSAIDSLSGGEKQRVALLRNVQFPPDILLLDEVSSALDDINKQIVQQMIDLLVSQGTAAIWISHDRHETEDGRRRLTLLPAGQERQHEPA